MNPIAAIGFSCGLAGFAAFSTADIIEGGQVNRSHPTLYAYFDAGDGLETTGGFGDIVAWHNIGLNGADPATRDLDRIIGVPLKIDNAINGLPTACFFGAEGIWAARDIFGEVLQPNSFCFVARTNEIDSDYFFDSSTSAQREACVIGPTNNVGNWALYAGVDFTPAVVVTEDVFQIHTVVFNGGSSTHYVNGEEIYSGDAGTQSLWGLILGARYTGGNNLWGDFAEFILYDESLSSSDRQAVEGYLSTKYNIPVTGGDCVADWNGDTIINTSDFLAYLNDFNAVQGGGTPTFGDPDLADPFGILNTSDFLAYLNAYNAGCP